MTTTYLPGSAEYKRADAKVNALTSTSLEGGQEFARAVHHLLDVHRAWDSSGLDAIDLARVMPPEADDDVIDALYVLAGMMFIEVPKRGDLKKALAARHRGDKVFICWKLGEKTRAGTR
jgi:hypothetical protein